ncbi:ribosome small subunit-dependent GTPase, partial [Aphanothece stagnina RSMan2012]
MASDPAAPSAVAGLVVALQANYCWVELDHPGPGGELRLLCTRRTRLGKSGQTICVGDRVRLEGVDWAAGRGAVAALEPR